MKEREIERLNKLKEYEKKLYDKGIKYIAGIDEAGRGPLAGPVVVGCVIMPQDSFIEYVNEETNKIKAKYKVDINLTNYLLLAYYKKIEKRGFKVLTYDDNDVIIELSKDHTFRVI